MEIRILRQHALLIFLLLFLAPITISKFSDIQPNEFLCLGILGLTAVYLADVSRIRLESALQRLAAHWGIFALLALLLALVASSRIDFYPPTVARGDLLKTAPFLSFARLTQIMLCVFTMLFLTRLLTDDRRLFRFGTLAYVWIGVGNAGYAIASWLLVTFVHIDIGGAYDASILGDGGYRARALFNEGGPYGLYAVSVLLMAWFAYRNFRWMARGSLWLLVLLPVGISLALSQSRSGAVCLLAMMLWRGFRRIHIGAVLGAIIVAALFLFLTPFLDTVESYYAIYQNFDRVIMIHLDDANYAAGRIAALYAIPEIVKAHPLLGVGLGNYSLVRLDPQFGVPGIPDIWDLPGIGLLSYIGDLGIPLFLYLVFVVARPVKLARKAEAPEFVMLVAGYQLFAQAIEVQITFLYPWILSAFALAWCLLRIREQRCDEPVAVAAG